MADVDIIMLAYSKTAKEYNMTKNAIKSIRDAEKDHNIEIIVVETNTNLVKEAFTDENSPPGNKANKRLFNDKCLVLFPGGEFSYNKSLNFAYPYTTGDYLLIMNNDIIAYPGFITELIKGLEQADTVSSKCPVWGSHTMKLENEYGFDIGKTFCGWCIGMKSSLFHEIPFDILFPKDLKFWGQDDFAAAVLKTHDKRHMLCVKSLVKHLLSQSHSLLVDKQEMTWGQVEYYRKKIQEYKERKASN